MERILKHCLVNKPFEGPPEWPSICETCAGQRQSPIAIWANRISYEPDMTHLQLRNYNHEIAGITITDNGHTGHSYYEN